jgi:hypothetical protein
LTPVLKVLQFIEENTDARIYILCEKLWFFICLLLTAVVLHVKIGLCIRPLSNNENALEKIYLKNPGLIAQQKHQA